MKLFILALLMSFGLERFIISCFTPFELIVTNFTYRFNPKYVNCTMKRDGQMFNGIVSVLQRAPQVEGTVSFNVALLAKDEFNYRNIYKRTLNLCKFFAKPSREILLSLFYRELARTDVGNLPSKCPIEPTTFKLENFSMQSRYFPPMPLGFHFKAIFGTIFLMPERINVYDAALEGKVQSKKP